MIQLHTQVLPARIRLLLISLCSCTLCLHIEAADVDGPDKARTVAVKMANVRGDFPDVTAWGQAHAATPFLGAGDTDKKRSNEASVLYDDRALYVRVRITDPQIDQHKPKREGEPGSRGVWSNDCVELFLGSPTDPSAKLHLALDVLGQRYHNPALPWHCRAKRDAKGYTVVFAMPFASIPWEGHDRGDVWKIKFGHESKTGLGNSMWPVNFSGAFHAEKAWGLLYFDTDNLMRDGGFEEMAASRNPGRSTWSLMSGDVGTLDVVKSPLLGEGHAARLTKTKAAPSWYPYLHSAGRLPLQKGRSYIVSAWVQTAEPWVFRCYFHKKGEQKYIKALRIKQKPSPGKMQYFEVPFVMPDEADTFHPGFRFARAQTGAMVIDNVALRIDPFGMSAMGAKEGIAHPIHNLQELAHRGRILPAHLRDRGLKRYPSERVVFRDSATGATLWKMTRWPGESRHQYANMLCWNANASLLKIISTRARNLLLTSDGREMLKLDVPDGDWINRWCPVRPERLYVSEYRGDKKVHYVYDVYAHTKRYLPGTYPREGTTMWVPHPDGKYLLVVENSQSRTAKTSFGHVIDPETGRATTFDFQGTTHQVWFTKRPDHLIYFGYESANKYYTYARDGAWLINSDGTGLRRVYQPKWLHRDFSPDGQRVAFHNVGLVVVDVMDGGNEEQVSSHSGGHATWQVTPEWFVSSTQGVLRCVGAQGQGFDYVLCHSLFQSPFENFGGRERPCSSPDGTKVAYSSSMMGDFDFYNVVSRLPHAPREVRARLEGSTVHLRWSPARYHEETKGYFVYRSFESGGSYRQLNAGSVQETTFTDQLPRGKSHAFYLVTAIEHCGLEGRLSRETCASPAGAWQGPVRRYFEMEAAKPAKPLMEFFDSAASCMYVMRMDRAASGHAAMAIDVPAGGRYAVWLRTKSMGDAGRVNVSLGDQRLAVDSLAAKTYRWSKLGSLDLPKGTSELAFDVQGKRLRLDALFVTDDRKAQPRDALLWDSTPPASPRGLRADRVGKSHVQLRWDAVSDMDVAHYNVYASRKQEYEPSQERLVASPIDPEYTDWGLKQGATYYYRACAVDRRGNMSQPSREVAAQTVGAGEVVLARKRVGDARKGLPAETSKARKQLEQMGAFAERAHRLTKADPLKVKLAVPSDGQYVLWVKYGLAARKGRLAMRITAAGERSAVGWALRFVGSGHSVGFKYNAGAFVWEQGQTGVGRYNRTRVFDLKQGETEFTLTTDGESHFEVAEVVLTNDLGHQPEGIHCYRPGNPEWLKD